MKPIIIIANYRTGSTAYCRYLADQHNFAKFTEPHYRTDFFKELSTMVSESKKEFVLKIMPDQVSRYKIYQQILHQDCYTIKLTRKDKIEQIVSFYIAKQTDAWNSSDPNFRNQQYTVPIVESELTNAIKYILDMDQLLETSGIKFDEEITYESIEPFIKSSNIIKLTKKLAPPSNYKELKQHTAQLISDLGQNVT